jgi:hypothetical protein
MAGKGKKTFVAGEVLLAQDVNDYLMDQSVMNFASSAARASAIPTPTEGMTTYVQDRNQIETFDGTEYRGMSGLQLVKKQAIDTGVSSVVVTDAFSATYDAYKIVVANTTLSSGVSLLRMTLGATNTGYFFTTTAALFSTGAYSSQLAAANAASFAASGNPNASNVSNDIELISPFLSAKTFYHANYVNVAGGAAGILSGYLNNTLSYTAFTLAPDGGTMTGGTIYVYGYGT